eukprot:Gregarina_sp_Poly_1__2163@NODE_1573_length_3817_cov_125_911200_g1040_i0_p4_GENE_NODE_1573_length_3817_cov_125_911200_g1040_i0NODE_1573_length_3817_cov_125_911200_g1040_i0_p4_ORF_typecomplete_len192_score33_03CSN5_C/PF18323_1/0_1DmpG_comm/PF07836_11/0_072ACPS/PF01648_20/0_072WEMBL/PF05701_11/0_07AAA_13/PF13166_6/0_075GBP_C/PF02841_14/0_15MutS_IV/PF05190_18/0_13MutS_IV/PF05190_18/3_6e02Tropomyosin/PF00261_20/3_2DUF812/PF05667_11/1Cas_Cas1/PF01867_16/1_7Cas_Cas1/PF01867_16/7_1e02FUSC/PF04632_12/1_6
MASPNDRDIENLTRAICQLQEDIDKNSADEGLEQTKPQSYSLGYNGVHSYYIKQVADLEQKLEAATRVADASLRTQQGCLQRETALRQKLEDALRRAESAESERDLLLKQRNEMAASAKVVEAYVRRWALKEQQYKEHEEKSRSKIEALESTIQQMLLHIDELTEHLHFCEKNHSLVRSISSASWYRNPQH